MTDTNQNNDAILLAKLKKFMGKTFLGIFVACIIGGVGGWLVYQNSAPGSKVFGIELLMPTIIATVVMMIVLSVVKKKTFANKEEFQRATELFKESTQPKK